MLLTVGEFKQQVQDRIDHLVAGLQDETGRRSPSEIDAWRTSLPILARVLDPRYFDNLHLYFGGTGNLALEYKLPGASGWCDTVLLGRGADGPTAVIIELKHWNTIGDRPGRYTGLIVHRGREESHPSDQVKGYVEYCRLFHSAVQEQSALVNGCVLFTTSGEIAAYRAPPNDTLAAAFPMFTATIGDETRIPHFLEEHLRGPDEQFAKAFAEGRYSQPRALLIQVGIAIADETRSPFVLIDQQRTAFAVSMAEARESMDSGEKRVVIITGPPGSGKSVVAARLWADLAKDYGYEGRSVNMVTTSDSQYGNWASLFAEVSGIPGTEGFVQKANGFIPWTMPQVKAAEEQLGVVWRSAEQWETNLRAAAAAGMPAPKMADNRTGVAIVDEAHALVNPEVKAARGITGYSLALGPQAFHIIRGSRVTIFLTDPAQGYRDKESTTVDDLKRFAALLGAKVTEVDLTGNQFRCGGSVEYTEWVEGLLAGRSPDELRALADQWRAPADAPLGVEYKHRGRKYQPRAPGRLVLRVFDDPHELESALRSRVREGHTARLLSSYSVPWKTKDVADPHELSPQERDFHFETPDQYPGHWSKVWNVTPRGSYVPFVQGRPGPGSRMAEDPLSEVGCPYVVRGFDYDYVGILWLGDLAWDQDRWWVDSEHMCESGLTRTAQAVARGALEPEVLVQRVAEAYRILLTRPIHGVYLWVPDSATRGRIESALGRAG